MKKLVVFKISTECNMACKYCYEKLSSQHFSGKIMDADILIKRIADATQEYGSERAFTFVLHGGEPLLMGKDYYLRIIASLNYANEKGCRTRLALQTNGTIIDREWIDVIKQTLGYLYEHLGISIDGPKSLNDACRVFKNGKGTFNKVSKNMLILKENRIPFGVLLVVGKHNVNHPEEMFDYILKADLGGVRFLPCLDVDDNGNLKDYSIAPSEYSEFLKNIFKLWLKSPNYADITVDPLATIIQKIIGEKVNWCEYCDKKCQDFITIYPNGNMYHCGTFIKDEDHLIKNIYKVDDTELLNILSNKTTAVDKVVNVLNKKCATCSVSQICQGGCVGIRETLFKNNYELYNDYCIAKRSIINYVKEAIGRV